MQKSHCSLSGSIQVLNHMSESNKEPNNRDGNEARHSFTAVVRHKATMGNLTKG